MLGENIKKFRTLRGISLRKFGELVGLSQTAIAKYERNVLKPDGEKLIKFAEVLNCKVSDLLKDNSCKRVLNLNFRKRKSLSDCRFESLKQIINNKVNNYLDVLELNEIKPKKIKKYKVSSIQDAEKAAETFRKDHQINYMIPLGNLCAIIENLNISVIIINNDSNQFDGFDGVSEIVNGFPFICISSDMNYYRQRFTLAHELGHLLLEIGDQENEEKICDAFASSLLLPKRALIWECGEKRFGITDREYKIIREEYNASIKTIITALEKYNVITSNSAKMAFINYNKKYKNEEFNNFGKQSELPRMYEQLVLRLFTQKVITKSKFNELMDGYLIDL